MAKVLIVRLSAIGDVAMTIPVIYSAAKENPDDSFTVVTQTFLTPLFINKPTNVFLLGIVIKGPEKKSGGFLRFAYGLARQDYDVVIDLHNVIRSRIINLFCLFAGKQVFILNKIRKQRKQLTKKPPKQLSPLRTTIERYADVFHEAGFYFEDTFTPFWSAKESAPVLNESGKNAPPHAVISRNEAKQVFKQRMTIKNTIATWTRHCGLDPQSHRKFIPIFQEIAGQARNDAAEHDIMGNEAIQLPALNDGRKDKPSHTVITKKGRWIGIAPFAKHFGKIYPVDKMEKVVELLSKQPDTTLFLLGGGSDEEKTLGQWEQKWPNTHCMAGRYNLPQTLELISRMDLVVCMDSACMHFASLVGTKVVSIWGATHPFLGFYGYKQNPDYAVQVDLPCRPCSDYGKKPCHRKDYACLMQITPEQITEKINYVMGKI